MSYLELLKLASPEAIVAVTALVVLAIGLATERGSAFCSAIATFGLAIAIGAVLVLPQNATLFGGMLVITPLTSLFKIICLVLALFTVFLAHNDRFSRNPGRVSRHASACHDRTHVARRQRRTAHDLHRPRAHRALALCYGGVRQNRRPLR